MLFEAQTIRGKGEGPRLLIVAGVHGDEWEPMVAVRRLAGTLQPDEVRGIVTLVPVLNVPAYRAGRRVGPDGLDLARTFPGRPDGSPTQQIAYEFTSLLDRADYLIDLHTGGLQLSVWPLAGYLIHPDAEILQQQRRMARAFGLDAVWGNDPTLEGRTLSAARDRSVPAIYVEYLGSVPFNVVAVEALIGGCRRVMAELGMIDFPGTHPKPRFAAEDTGSGHLQANCPAPADGLFEPYVNAGDSVKQGELIGYLTPDASAKRGPILAEKSGHVVAIRMFPRIAAGEAMVVIAPFEELCYD